MYYLCIRLQINISVLFCSALAGGGGGEGVLDTSLSGEVRPGPSYPDPL